MSYLESANICIQQSDEYNSMDNKDAQIACLTLANIFMNMYLVSTPIDQLAPLENLDG